MFKLLPHHLELILLVWNKELVNDALNFRGFKMHSFVYRDRKPSAFHSAALHMNVYPGL